MQPDERGKGLLRGSGGYAPNSCFRDSRDFFQAPPWPWCSPAGKTETWRRGRGRSALYRCCGGPWVFGGLCPGLSGTFHRRKAPWRRDHRKNAHGGPRNGQRCPPPQSAAEYLISHSCGDGHHHPYQYAGYADHDPLYTPCRYSAGAFCPDGARCQPGGTAHFFVRFI